MITKQEVIEILEAALNHSSYLGQGEDLNNWFCYVVDRVVEEKGLDSDIAVNIQNMYIYPSINNHGLLRLYLVDMGKIHNFTTYYCPEYKTAAFEHWTNLIKKIKGEV